MLEGIRGFVAGGAGRGRVFQGEGKEKRMFSIETFYGKITR